MSLDGTSLTLIGLVFAGLGVLATFLAPRFVGQSRLHFQEGVISRLRHKERLGEIRISVVSGGEDIEGEIYLASGKIVNSGSKDISFDNFVDPIKLSLNGPYKLVSFDAISQDGVGLTFNRESDSGILSWRILKPGESISLRFVISSQIEIARRRYRNLITPTIRLRDVKTGRAIGDRLKIRQFLIVLGILSAVTAGPIVFIASSASNEIVYEKSDGIKRLRLIDGRIQECGVEQKRFYFRRCEEITSAIASRNISSSQIKSVFNGFNSLAILAIASVIILYSGALTYSSDRLLQIVRFPRRRRSSWED